MSPSLKWLSSSTQGPLLAALASSDLRQGAAARSLQMPAADPPLLPSKQSAAFARMPLASSYRPLLAGSLPVFPSLGERDFSAQFLLPTALSFSD